MSPLKGPRLRAFDKGDAARYVALMKFGWFQRTALWVLWAAFLANGAVAKESQPFFVVSDVDDTVRLSHVLDPLDSVRRVLFTHQTFAGTGFLYGELESISRFQITFLSGSPPFLRTSVERTLDAGGFPKERTVLLRRDLDESIEAFKIESISRLLEALPSEFQVLLIGDDGQKDPETYWEVRARYPRQVAAIYIHRIQGRRIPEGEIGYDLASELALHELRRGVLSPVSVQKIAADTIQEGQRDSETLALPGSYCPRTGTPAASDELSGDLKGTPGGSAALEAARQAEALLRWICDERARTGEIAGKG